MRPRLRVFPCTLLALCIASLAKADTSIDVSTYGAVPNSGQDATVAFKNAIAAAAAAPKPVTLNIPTGRYDFFIANATQRACYTSNSTDPGTNAIRTIGVDLSNLDQVTVQGNGSTLMMRGAMTMLVAENSTNLTLSGLSFDFARPAVSEIKVLSKATDSWIGQVHPDCTYTITGGNRVLWTGENWQSYHNMCQPYDPNRKITWRGGDPTSSATSIVDLGGGKLQFFVPAGTLGNATVGFTYQFRNTARDQVGMWFNRCQNVTMQDVNVYSMRGFGILAQFTENVHYQRLYVGPKAGSGRTCASGADITHFSGCKGLINIEDSTLSAAQDDAMNVHGTHLQIKEVPTSNQIRVRFMQSQSWGFLAFQAGDQIEFVKANTLLSYGNAVVTNVQMLTDIHEQLVTLDRNVPAGVTLNSDVVENITWTPSVQITNCDVGQVPVRGFLLTTRQPVVVQGCRFFRTQMPAILVEDDAASWFESGPVRNMTLRGNAFFESGGNAIQFSPSVSAYAGAVHSNITIADNDFTLPGSTAMSFNAVSNISVTGNRFRMRNNTVPAVTSLTSQSNTTGITYSNNIVEAASTPAISTNNGNFEAPAIASTAEVSGPVTNWWGPADGTLRQEGSGNVVSDVANGYTASRSAMMTAGGYTYQRVGSMDPSQGSNLQWSVTQLKSAIDSTLSGPLTLEFFTWDARFTAAANTDPETSGMKLLGSFSVPAMLSGTNSRINSGNLDLSGCPAGTAVWARLSSNSTQSARIDNFTTTMTAVAGPDTDGTWTNASGGSWATGGNWNANLIAHGAGKTADFSTLNLTSDATVNFDGALTIGNLVFGDITASHNWTLNSSGASLTLDVATATPAITVNNQTTTISPVLAGTKGLTKAGAGTLVVTGDNTYTGATTINGGTLDLKTPSFNTYRGGQISINNGSTLKLEDGGGSHRYDFGALTYNFDASGGGTITTVGSSMNWVAQGTWTFKTNGGAKNTINGPAWINTNGKSIVFDVSRGSDATSDLDVALNVGNSGGSVTKTGTGIASLSAANTYTGSTTINGGTLRVNGSIGAGVVTVANTAALGGTGTIGGAVNVQSGGTLAPGVGGIGTLTVNNTLNLAGTTAMEISKAGATLTSDKVSGVSTVTYGGSLVVTNVGPDALAAGNSFQLLSATNRTGSFSSITLPTLGAGLVWDTSRLSVNGTISVGSIPVAVNDSATTLQNSAVTIAVLANDTDADGDTLAIQSVTQGAHGSVAIAGTSVTYTPAANWSGTDSFTYTITDNQDGTSTATVSVTVTPVNHPPTFTANPITGAGATEDSAYSGTLAGSATDPDAGDTLTYSKVSGPAWLSVVANGALSGTPGNSDVGANSFTVNVTDAAGASATATLNITITSVNHAPTFTANPINKPNGTQDSTYSDTIAGSATDIDAGDTLIYSKVSGPAWLTVAANGALSGTPSVAALGTNSFTVRVTDTGGLYADATLQITVVPANGTAVWINASGGSWAAPANWGAGIIGTGADTTANFSTLDLTTNATVTLDGARTIGNLVFGDTTPSNTWTLNAGTGGALTLDVASGTPAITVNNQSSTISLVLAGTKGISKAGAGTLFLSGANTYTGASTVGAGTLKLTGANSVKTSSAFVINLLAVLEDDSNALGAGVGAKITNPTVSGAGTLVQKGSGTNWLANNTGTSAGNQVQFNFGAGGLVDVQTGVLGAISTNATNLGALNIASGAQVTMNTSGPSNPGKHFDALTGGGSLTLYYNSVYGSNGTQTLYLGENNTAGTQYNTAGTATFAGAIGQAGVTLSVIKKGTGTQVLTGSNTYTGTTTVNAGTLLINGTLANTATTVANGGTLAGIGTIGGAVTVQSGGALAPGAGGIGTLRVNNTLNLGGTTAMEISKSGTTLTTDKVSGMSTVTYGGSLEVTNVGPDALAAGNIFQLFSATTYAGGFSSITLPTLSAGLVWDTSRLSVNGTISVGSIPVAVNDAATTLEDTPVSIAVLANDTDADGDTLVIQSVTQGANGTVTIAGTGVTYTPAANWYGTDSFTYTITDNQDGTSTATVSVAVSAVNDAPVFTSDPINGGGATQGAAYSGSLAGSATDVDAGDTLTYSKASGPAWLSVAATGALSGTPGNSDVGANSFTVKVTDPAGASSESVLAITVINVNDAPTFTANPINRPDATQDSPYSATIAGCATDIDAGDTLKYSKVSGPAWMNVAADGALSGTPGNSDVGANVFTVKVTDPAGASSESVLAITVINVNDAPTFTANPINRPDATQDSPYSATIAGCATDIDAGDTLTYSKVSGPAWLSVAANGALSGTPGNSDVGANVFTVKVTDAAGATDTATLNITVINVNDPPTFTTNPITKSSATQNRSYSDTIAGSATDPDTGDALTYSKASGPVWLTVASSGALSGTPSRSDVGANTFTVKVTDAAGATATATLNITVTKVNDAPTFTVNSINKPDGTHAKAYSNTISGAATDVDAGDTLTYSKVSGPAWLTVAADGALSGTPVGTDVGGNSWTVRATDSDGATANATLNITVDGLPLPSGWSGGDIGSVGLAGSSTQDAGAYTIKGSGADIGGTTDAFQFVSQSLSGDGEIRARVTSQTNTNAWAKAGVMIRETSEAGSANALIAITPGNGFTFQYRSATGGSSLSVAGPALNGAPNNWVRLTRSGTLITSYVSADGVSWTPVGTAVISMTSTVKAGLAVTSHDNTQLSTATFDNVTVTAFPAPWQTVDVGNTGLQGSAESYNSTYTVKGAGAVSLTSDGFRFVYQALSGDGEIKARIAAPANTGTNARMGVMIRESLTSDSAYTFMGVNEARDFVWQARKKAGHNTFLTTSGTGVAPNIWVRIVRAGETLTGYASSDGVNWTLVDDRKIDMASNIYVGLVTAGGSTSTLNTAVFDNVTVVP